MKYTELEIPLVPFFFLFFAREHPRKQFRNAPRGMEGAGMGEKLGRGREKNFLIGRIVEQPSAQSYNFSIVSKLPDSFPRHSARARISDSKRTRDTGAIGIPLLRPVSS